jgi:hypothetical protein
MEMVILQQSCCVRAIYGQLNGAESKKVTVSKVCVSYSARKGKENEGSTKAKRMRRETTSPVVRREATNGPRWDDGGGEK